MGPEVVLRFTPDALLQHLEETVADGVLRHVFRVFGDEHHVRLVITASYASHVKVIDSVVHLTHDTLSAREHRCLRMVEEREP